ncbi:TCP-1/cpn60 chaperonin family protein [Candidatus Woesearchaeota archaeon]|nr:TCP-1/cpn60 chaperonin family protein [Candidatus Woesearchaeota archaeon]
MPQNSSSILPEDTRRTTGREAQHNNILAAKAVANTVRTTLGPKGMDKMIVDEVGNVIISNDGVTILKEMKIEHPAAKMVVEVAQTQEDAVGDGTTTAVVLAGEFLRRAEHLLEQEIHPTVLTKGYRLAEQEAQRLLQIGATRINLSEDHILKQIAITAMTGKGAEGSKEKLADLIVQAVRKVVAESIEKKAFSREDIKVEKLVGESTEKSELISGIVIDKERLQAGMPQKVSSAKIALLDVSLEIKNTEIDAKIQITDPGQLQGFLDQEEQTLRLMVNRIIASGATVVFCQRGVDDLAQHFLAKAGILAVRRVKKSDMERLARATGAKIMGNLKELTAGDLGFAGVVREEKMGDGEMIFVEQCKHPKAVTLLIRGGTVHVTEEIQRAVTDAIGDIAAALQDGAVVAGAGAIEMELAKGIRSFASSLRGREQLAVQEFADALEVIPRTLAENAGLDPIDVLTALRSAHDRGEKFAGINVFSGQVMNAWQEGVIEPLKIKTQAISSATEVAELILRIDDVILGNRQEKLKRMMPGEMVES